ncbi:extracellular solute-binding protein [Horticoccus luteus]|uniref:Extracellular solute-binding protein n=1 Tax=Horticoccus luteus TaxID=2862869 RepID=A0A8F9TT97_9BACT|nr:extracellular solute-binding protein [Horticoccus luteus]QYM78645.1 extracellular solute-binding protein [Horticoccus luteus]
MPQPAFIVLAAAYLVSAAVVFRRTAAPTPPGQVTIRFSQWQLEGTVREALDAIIKRYEELNPHVKVERIDVPGSDTIYLPWVQTQMVGGTGPDLVEYVWAWPNIPRYFQPIDDEVVKPNPYNRGTPLEGVAWRDTNVDGMTNEDSFVKALNHYYAITVTSHIPRLVYNRAMLKTITGAETPPADYRAFLALCATTKRYAQTHGLTLSPLAMSKDSYAFVMYAIMSCELTGLAERLDFDHRLRITDLEAAGDYLRGDWSYNTPDVVAALHLLRELGDVSTPGFLQRTRDAALADFVNGRALMAVVPSWDASSLLQMCPFAIGAFRYPHPREDDPVYGRFTRGPFSEGPVLTGMGFYLNRTTKHRAEALDFLRFLTSQEGATLFTNISNWQPATIGVRPSNFAAQFTQETEGIGWGASFMGLTGTDALNYLRTQISKLWGEGGSVEAYRAAINAGVEGVIREDLRRLESAGRQNMCREDAVAAAKVELAPRDHPAEALPLATVMNEATLYQQRELLAQPRRQ